VALASLLTPPRIGLVAGWGRYPVIIAEALKQQGYHVSCLGVAGHASRELQTLCDDFCWIGLGKLGKAIRYCHRQRLHHATMAGKFHKVMLFQPWVWLKHLPDWRAIKAFYPHFVATKADRKDDTLLAALIHEFERDGIYFAPATDYAPELLVKAGQHAGPPLSGSQQADITFGWELAKAMGRLDVGQSVCVKDRAVLAVEAIEGTDQCIRRAGELCRSGGFTIVKTAKPQQDMRFDVPTIGLGTLETMVAARAKVLAIEADRTIILDEPACLAFANRHKLAIVALDRQGAEAA